MFSSLFILLISQPSSGFPYWLIYSDYCSPLVWKVTPPQAQNGLSAVWWCVPVPLFCSSVHDRRRQKTGMTPSWLLLDLRLLCPGPKDASCGNKGCLSRMSWTSIQWALCWDHCIRWTNYANACKDAAVLLLRSFSEASTCHDLCWTYDFKKWQNHSHFILCNHECISP